MNLKNNKMKAIILAAGIGSRLKNLTTNKPKALIEVGGVPMLGIVINKLIKFGIDEIMINIHHHGDKILRFLEEKDDFGINISISDEREMLLNTGGAILNMRNFIVGTDPVLIHNVDIISDLSLDKLFDYHTKTKSIATLCTRDRVTNRGLLFNTNNELCGWTNSATKEFKWVNKPERDYYKRAFSGIYVISPEFIDRITFSGSFSIIDAWLAIARDNRIVCFHDSTGNWYDLGTIEKIKEYEKHNT